MMFAKGAAVGAAAGHMRRQDQKRTEENERAAVGAAAAAELPGEPQSLQPRLCRLHGRQELHRSLTVAEETSLMNSITRKVLAATAGLLCATAASAEFRRFRAVDVLPGTDYGV